jgi:hypothetical protein
MDYGEIFDLAIDSSVLLVPTISAAPTACGSQPLTVVSAPSINRRACYAAFLPKETLQWKKNSPKTLVCCE